MVGYSVSVVIPVRNRKDTIIRAIDSAINQSLSPVEVIVVDDGSTDGTVATVTAHGYDARVRVVANPDPGSACRARNLGVSLATGNCIALLDSDDAWRADKLAEQVRLLDLNPQAPAVFNNFEYVGGTVARSHIPSVVYLDMLYEENVLGGCSAAMIRKAAFDQVGGFEPDMPSCQDWDLWLKLAAHGPIPCHPECLTLYYFDGFERISSNSTKVVAGHNTIFAKIYTAITDSNRLKYVKKYHKFLMARTTFHGLNDRSISRGYVKAALLDPPNLRKFLSAAKLYVKGLG